jgi:hypothetical protein
MRWLATSRAVRSVPVALIAAVMVVSTALATHGGTHVDLQADTKGCTGVLPSTDGNTDMRVVGGSLEPGGTAVFEITYPLDAANIGKEFTITACAFINDVAALKYLVSFVPSNQSFVLQMTFAIPDDAPVGGQYCNYAKTTRSPTAAQASQRKAGPACFIIRAPRVTTVTPPSTPTTPTTPSSGGSAAPPRTTTPATPAGGGPILLPDTAMPRPGSS